MIEVRPPLTEAGVRRSTHGHEVHGVLVVEAADEPRSWRGCLREVVEFVDCIVAEKLRAGDQAAISFRSTSWPLSNLAPARTSGTGVR
ncbi:hypothetical protein [Streptomyces sp. MN13]